MGDKENSQNNLIELPADPSGSLHSKEMLLSSIAAVDTMVKSVLITELLRKEYIIIINMITLNHH